jgi:hypothetical protein
VLICGKPACLEGDETSATVAPVSYDDGTFVGGTGALMVSKVSVTKKVTSGNKALLLEGEFEFKFMVLTSAIDKTSGISDPIGFADGTGKFATTNTKVTAI